MPLLATKAIGEIEVKTSECYCFNDGLYGFSDCTDFALVRETPDSPFLWLQSTQQVNLAFVVIQPHLFYKKTYVPQIPATDLDFLGIRSLDECLIYVIVTIPDEHPEEMTANLQGPILLNTENHKGKQVISLDNSHEVRISILNQLEK